jgi:hypothetical protein
MGVSEMMTVRFALWSDLTDLTLKALRTASFTWLSHMLQAMPSTPTVILYMKEPPESEEAE